MPRQPKPTRGIEWNKENLLRNKCVIKWPIMQVIGVPEVVEREAGTKCVYNEIINEKFPNIKK